jgi:RNA polymerase sigma factor (sigma-70 family)
MAGNKELFETLHRTYQAMVLQLCLGFMKGDRDVAKDLSQEVFINTWQALPKFNNASSPKTWIYRITVNTCLKYIRDKKDQVQVSIDEGHSQLPEEPGQSPETTHQSLYQAIGQLSEVDRLIMMMILDELDYAEISTIIGISEGNLRVKIHRIKKNLKKILENE